MRTLQITICCGDGIISNRLGHTQYIIFTCRKLSLANGTVYRLHATKLFNSIPPNIKNLNHDIQEFLWRRFRSAYYAQSWSVQEPAFIENPKKKNWHAKN